jgi:hypothetical protein
MRKNSPLTIASNLSINNSMLMDANNAAHTRTLSHYAADEYTLKVLSQVFEWESYALFMEYQENIETKEGINMYRKKIPSIKLKNKNGKFV